MSLPAPSSRRHDLDWLRVIAFGLLIFYHIGMGYVPWDWHVKSPHVSEAWRLPMLMVNPWRLALLFFISGVALRFAIDKFGSRPLGIKQAIRLGVPIVFGMAVIVMPQGYFELLAKGEIEPGLFDFWPRYLTSDSFSIVTPTWNHLWYVVYLLAYTLLIILAASWLNRVPETKAYKTVASHPVAVLLVFALPFVVNEYVLGPRFPTTHAFIGDWSTHAESLSILLIGFWAAKSEAFWQSVRRGLPFFLTTTLALGVWRLLGESGGGEGLDGFALTVVIATWPIANVLYAWSVILSLLGLAQRLLNRPSKVLRYLTGAVFCYYILHQTLTVTLIARLGQNNMSGAMELTLVILGTVGGCVAGYEILRRVPGMRVAFGIKP